MASGARRALVQLLIMMVTTVEADPQRDGSGSGSILPDNDAEQRIVLSLTIVGVVLVALSLLGMRAASAQVDRSEEVYIRDHRSGAVDALLGKASSERRDPNLTPAERSAKSDVRHHLLQSFTKGWDTSEDSTNRAEQQKEIDR